MSGHFFVASKASAKLSFVTPESGVVGDLVGTVAWPPKRERNSQRLQDLETARRSFHRHQQLANFAGSTRKLKTMVFLPLSCTVLVDKGSENSLQLAKFMTLTRK
jgi:hypothetical protein